MNSSPTTDMTVLKKKKTVNWNIFYWYAETEKFMETWNLSFCLLELIPWVYLIREFWSSGFTQLMSGWWAPVFVQCHSTQTLNQHPESSRILHSKISSHVVFTQKKMVPKQLSVIWRSQGCCFGAPFHMGYCFGFWARLCKLHAGLICIAFCLLSVCLSVCLSVWVYSGHIIHHSKYFFSSQHVVFNSEYISTLEKNDKRELSVNIKLHFLFFCKCHCGAKNFVFDLPFERAADAPEKGEHFNIIHYGFLRVYLLADRKTAG